MALKRLTNEVKLKNLVEIYFFFPSSVSASLYNGKQLKVLWFRILN